MPSILLKPTILFKFFLGKNIIIILYILFVWLLELFVMMYFHGTCLLLRVQGWPYDLCSMGMEVHGQVICSIRMTTMLCTTGAKSINKLPKRKLDFQSRSFFCNEQNPNIDHNRQKYFVSFSRVFVFNFMFPETCQVSAPTWNVPQNHLF